MLKRTLTLLVLTILALTLMGAGPVDSPSDVPMEGEIQAEVGNWLVIFVWGVTGTPLPGVEPVMREIDTPPSEVQEVYAGLTEETLTQVPERIRRRVAGDTSVAYNHHDFDCVLVVNRPWKSDSNVRAYAFWDCRAEAETSKTRLRLTLWRDLGVLMDANGGEWLSTRFQSRSVSGPCAPGLRLYYAEAHAGVRFYNGEQGYDFDLGQTWITC